MPSDERRAELLERAYRRGNELRVRRRRWLATLASVVVIVVAGASAIAVSATKDNARLSVGQTRSPNATTSSSSPSVTACAASISVVPRAKVPHDVASWAQGAAVVGNGALWTIRSAIDVPPNHQSNVWRLKFPWYTRPFGLPTITGRRLDGTGTFHANANPATDSRGTWVVSSLEFSSPGCWQVTSRYRTSTIRFRVHIPAPTPAASSSSAFGDLPAVPEAVSFTDARQGVGLTTHCAFDATRPKRCGQRRSGLRHRHPRVGRRWPKLDVDWRSPQGLVTRDGGAVPTSSLQQVVTTSGSMATGRSHLTTAVAPSTKNTSAASSTRSYPRARQYGRRWQAARNVKSTASYPPRFRAAHGDPWDDYPGRRDPGTPSACCVPRPMSPTSSRDSDRAMSCTPATTAGDRGAPDSCPTLS